MATEDEFDQEFSAEFRIITIEFRDGPKAGTVKQTGWTGIHLPATLGFPELKPGGYTTRPIGENHLEAFWQSDLFTEDQRHGSR